MIPLGETSAFNGAYNSVPLVALKSIFFGSGLSIGVRIVSQTLSENERDLHVTIISLSALSVFGMVMHSLCKGLEITTSCQAKRN